MVIRPFAALRPNQADAASVASVPYDVVDTREAAAIAAGNPNCFLHVSRPEIDLPPGTDPASDEAYAQARKALESLVARGVLVREIEPCFYVYELVMGAHSQVGLVATFDTKEYISGVLKQHEKTRRDKEDDRTRHIEVLKAHTEPAFLTYRDSDGVNRLVDEIRAASAPLVKHTASDGVVHTLWRVGPGEAAERLIALFADIPLAYIADGHHRSAAAARFARESDFAGESRYFLAVAFPASQMNILPYNRLVADLNGLSSADFLSRIAKDFTVDGDTSELAACRHCRMYLDGKWHTLAWRVPAPADAVQALDVSYLQDRLLGPVLGIRDVRTDERISFMGGIRGDAALVAKVDSGEAMVAFAMQGVGVEEMMAIADAGSIMPPKSTWFEPKLASGLFIHEI